MSGVINDLKGSISGRVHTWLENVRHRIGGSVHDGGHGFPDASIQSGWVTKLAASPRHGLNGVLDCVCLECTALARAELRRILRIPDSEPTYHPETIGANNMATISSNTVQTIAQVLLEAEQFIAGQPITVQIPEEKFEVAGVKVQIAAGNVTFTK